MARERDKVSARVMLGITSGFINDYHKTKGLRHTTRVGLYQSIRPIHPLIPDNTKRP